MAATNETLVVNSIPQETLIALGNGSLIEGIRKAQRIGSSIKVAFHNMFLVTGTDTVGADTLVNVKFDIYTPFMLCAMNIDNDASATIFTGLKVNGEFLTPKGASADSVGALSFADLCTMDNVDWTVIIPKCDFEVLGTATNADVVTITLAGIDLTPSVAGG